MQLAVRWVVRRAFSTAVLTAQYWAVWKVQQLERHAAVMTAFPRAGYWAGHSAQKMGVSLVGSTVAMMEHCWGEQLAEHWAAHLAVKSDPYLVLRWAVRWAVTLVCLTAGVTVCM